MHRAHAFGRDARVLHGAQKLQRARRGVHRREPPAVFEKRGRRARKIRRRKRPLVPGDAVVATLSIEKVRNRGNLDMVTILVDLAVDGESVCEARSQLMHTRGEADA